MVVLCTERRKKMEKEQLKAWKIRKIVVTILDIFQSLVGQKISQQSFRNIFIFRFSKFLVAITNLIINRRHQLAKECSIFGLYLSLIWVSGVDPSSSAQFTKDLV